MILSLRNMFLTKKMKRMGYITAVVGQLQYPLFRGKGTNTEKFSACPGPTLSASEIIKPAVRLQESLGMGPVKARFRKRNRCGWAQR